MPGSSRTSMTTMVTVLVGIAGLIFILARAGAPIAGAEPAARGAVVEFTPDGKLKRPVGYRNGCTSAQSVTPNDLNGGKALFPEFHAIYIDPESFAEYEKTGKFRDGTVLVKELSSVGIQGNDQRQWLLPGRLHGLGGLDQGLEALQGRARQLGLLQLRPQVPAQGGGVQEALPPRATSATRTTPRRMIGSSPRTTPSCVRRPRIRSEVGTGRVRVGPSRARLIPQPEEMHTMNHQHSPLG